MSATIIKVENIDGLAGVALHRTVYVIDNTAYESVDLRRTDGMLVKFQDKQGKETKEIRLAPIKKIGTHDNQKSARY